MEEGGGGGCARAPHRRFVRRLPWSRPGEEPLRLITDVRDAAQYPAHDRVALARARGGIARGCQPITAVFPLQALRGPTPQGPRFPLAFCLVVDNRLQGGRAYVATAQARPAATIATALLFAEVQRQRVALTELLPPPQVESLCAPLPSPDSRCGQVTRRLETVWTPRWLKAPAKKPKAPTARKALRGNQTSVYRLLVAYRHQGVTSLTQ